ncbi:MAG: cysteine--tRNA ligase, partial [Candidatus Omnitrophota bacterium]
YRGIDVKLVRNVTDIDDKIIDRARKEAGTGDVTGAVLSDKAREVSEKYLAVYREDMDMLGITRPDAEPKATETIGDMIEFINLLIGRGYAYESSGNVYFDVRKFRDYGRLSGQGLDQMEEGARVALDKNKRDPLDFALWKASKPDEPFWPSPWGDGRPGWHIECSVMSTKLLGDDFVIHGGGIDLVFPHHENEIAQTVSAGKKSAKYWIHNGLLTINGQKMAKSLGNFITIRDFHDRYGDMDILKLMFLLSHYSHQVDFTGEKAESVRRSKERILIFLQKADMKAGRGGGGADDKENRWRAAFESAMDDDFNTPQALGAIFMCVDEGNKILEQPEPDAVARAELRAAGDFIKDVAGRVFGLNLEYAGGACDASLSRLIGERDEARRNRDFKRADEIRDELLSKGIILEDAKEGTIWRRKV